MRLRKQTAQILENYRTNRLGRIVNASLIVLILLNVGAIVLESVSGVFARYERAFWYFEVFSIAVFTIEYLARIWSSIDLEETRDASPIVGRIKYMFSPLALVDLVAILPFYLGLYRSVDLRFLRGLRLLRLFKLTRYSPALGAMLDVIQQEADALLAAIIVLLILLVMTSTGIYILEHDVQPEHFGSIPGAMWWAIVTLTTLGYGDVVPMTTGGKVFGGLIGLLGIGMIALPAAIMASGFVENVHARRQKYNLYAQRFLKDGVLDENERWQLEDLRKELGLESDEALELLRTALEEARDSTPLSCPHCGEALGQPRR